MTQYSLFDSEGNDYTQRDFDTLPESPDPERLDEVLQGIETADGKPLRLALVELADLAAAHPDESIPAAGPMCTLLDDAVPAVQGEALGFLTNIADADPEAVRPAVDAAIDRLSDGTHELLQYEALQFREPLLTTTWYCLQKQSHD